MNKTRTNILEIVEHIDPFDDREQADVLAAGNWVKSEASLYRLKRPDVPPQHLVSYIVMVDQARKSLLLLDHLKAGRWLPAGGHVETDEDPYNTAVRELAEELGLRAAQVATVARLPLFLTVTKTRGVGVHTDVSLWYVVAGDERMWLDPDPREFRAHRWLSYDKVLDMDIDELDPEMHRFVRKLQGRV